MKKVFYASVCLIKGDLVFQNFKSSGCLKQDQNIRSFGRSIFFEIKQIRLSAIGLVIGNCLYPREEFSLLLREQVSCDRELNFFPVNNFSYFLRNLYPKVSCSSHGRNLFFVSIYYLFKCGLHYLAMFKFFQRNIFCMFNEIIFSRLSNIVYCNA